MDLSDIIPWIVIIGASLLGTLGKSSKSKGGGVTKPKPTVRQATTTPPQVLPPVPDVWERRDMAEHDDWIPSNDVPDVPVSQSSVATGQAWENEGQRVVADESRRQALVGDPYAKSDDGNNAMPQDWKRAIIAHEILKTKF